MPRFVIIDDTDPCIQYSGPWFEVENTQRETGINGPPFNNTLHGVNATQDANFSFNFNGSAVIVYGTSITSNVSGTQDPSWECFIDNVSIGSSLPSASVATMGSQNNWILCGTGPTQLQDGPHVLTVKANASNQQTFWFDQIQYAPSSSVSLDNSLLRIDASDPGIQYSPGWTALEGPISYNFTLLYSNDVKYTQTKGANLIYYFNGTSILMFGTNVKGPVVLNATYVIDDQDSNPINFPDDNPSNIINFSNQVLFEIGNLSPAGQHKLNVTYLGNDTQSLYFNYFVQQNAPSSMSPISTGSPSGRGKFTGAIIGGVIGGLVLIFFIGLFFHRRRNIRRSRALGETPYTVPSLRLGSVKGALLSGLELWQTEKEKGLKRMTK